MRQILPLLLAMGLLSASAHGQTSEQPTLAAIQAIPIDSTTGQVHYSAVVLVPGVSKQELYTRAKAWALKMYNSPADVMRIADADVGVVECQGFADENVKVLGMGMKDRLYFTTRISVKEGRYKYEFSDLYFQSYPTNGTPDPPARTVEQYRKVSYSKTGKPYGGALNFMQVFLARERILSASIRQAMKGGDDW